MLNEGLSTSLAVGWKLPQFVLCGFSNMVTCLIKASKRGNLLAKRKSYFSKLIMEIISYHFCHIGETEITKSNSLFRGRNYKRMRILPQAIIGGHVKSLPTITFNMLNLSFSSPRKTHVDSIKNHSPNMAKSAPLLVFFNFS